MAPRISVVTVSLNQGEFIEENIRSVLSQNYPEVEHIIIDAGSTDSTHAVLKRFPHLKVTIEPDRGQSDGLNKGFAQATGDIIVWLNSDDWLPPGVFARVVEELRHRPIVMGACEVTDRQGRTTLTVPNYPRSWNDLLKFWINYASPAQPSIMFRREVLEFARGSAPWVFDPELHYAMDLDFWLRIARRYPLDHSIPVTLSKYRMYEDNKTGKEFELVLKEMRRVFRRHAAWGAQSNHRYSFISDGSGDLIGLFSGFSAEALNESELVLRSVRGDATLKALACTLTERFPRLLVRQSFGVGKALPAIRDVVRGEIAIVLGRELPPAGVFAAFPELFTNPVVGGVFLLGKPLSDPNLAPDQLFDPTLPVADTFAVRSVAFTEVGGAISLLANSTVYPRAVGVKLAFGGWRLGALPVDAHLGRKLEPLDAAFGEATVVHQCAEELLREPFARLRQQEGFAFFPITESLATSARKALAEFAARGIVPR